MQHALSRSVATSEYQQQQRHLLALMGIKVWVDRDTPTRNFDNTTFDKKPASTDNQVEIHPAIQATQQASTAMPVSTPISMLVSPTERAPSNNLEADNTNYYDRDDNVIDNDPYHAQISSIDSPAYPSAFTQQPIQERPSTEQPVGSTPTNNSPLSTHVNQEQAICAFSLIGAQYKAWVLVVDTRVFDTPSVAKLWENMVQTLSLTTHSISFPFCDSMQDAAIANATLSGFIFSIAEREETQVALLSSLPDGLQDERIIQVPSLEQMLQDSQFKRHFWELIR